MAHAHHHQVHSHGPHHHGPVSYGPAFALGVTLNLAFVAVEAVCGFLAGSLALLADAGHNLADVFSLLLAWVALWLSQRPPTRRRTYGFRRSSVLAALANAVLLLIAVGAIALEAVQRFEHPKPLMTGTVIWVAAAGVVVNAGTAALFMSGRKGDMNIRGAFLHMAADAGVSLGVVIAALAIQITGWLWLDPAMSLAIALVITFGTWNLLSESINLALDAVPAGIDPVEVEAFLAGQPGVTEVHDLHIWAMSTTETALTVHLMRPGHAVDDLFIAQLAHDLQDRFDIAHPTVQIESGESEKICRLAGADVV